MTEKEEILLRDSWCRDALRDQILFPFSWAKAKGAIYTEREKEYFEQGWKMGWRHAVSLAKLHGFLKVEENKK